MEFIRTVQRLRAGEYKTSGTSIDALLASTSIGQEKDEREAPKAPEVPEGWVPTLDAATGQTYYYSPALQITQWEMPTVPLITSPVNNGGEAPPVVPGAPSSADIFHFGRRPSIREQEDPLYKAFSVLNLGSPDNVLTAQELAQEMSIDYLQQQLPAAYDQFDNTGNGRVHTAEILRRLDGNGKVSLTEFLRVARAVRAAAGTDAPAASHYNPSGMQGFGI